MMLKIITLFLIAMGVMAMFGKLRFPSLPKRRGGALAKPKTCPKCGGYIIGKTGCNCAPNTKE
ncbi:MAG: hypothetical protein ACI9O0_000786 [Paracoccaceae bacterium]|jgi:hypothetical protein